MRRLLYVLSLMTAVSSGTSFHMPTRRTDPAAPSTKSTLRMTPPSEDINIPSPPPLNKKLIVPVAALATISTTTIAAFTGAREVGPGRSGSDLLARLQAAQRVHVKQECAKGTSTIQMRRSGRSLASARRYQQKDNLQLNR